MENERLSAMQWVQGAALLAAWCCAASPSCSLFSLENMAVTGVLLLDLVCICDWFLPPVPFMDVFSPSLILLYLLCFFFSMRAPFASKWKWNLAKPYLLSPRYIFLQYLRPRRDARFAIGTGKYFVTDASSLFTMFWSAGVQHSDAMCTAETKAFSLLWQKASVGELPLQCSGHSDRHVKGCVYCVRRGSVPCHLSGLGLSLAGSGSVVADVPFPVRRGVWGAARRRGRAVAGSVRTDVPLDVKGSSVLFQCCCQSLGARASDAFLGLNYWVPLFVLLASPAASNCKTS